MVDAGVVTSYPVSTLNLALARKPCGPVTCTVYVPAGISPAKNSCAWLIV